MQVNRYPKFLGVKCDRLLRFTEHVKYVSEKVQKRLNVLARLSGTTWETQDEDLQRLYLQWIQPVIIYGHGAWLAGCCSSAQMLNRINRHAALIASG